jgi:enamine deaminase RidA (YjgF/YER057c/UK114 family)
MAETPGYRYAEKVGPQLFVAGQVPLDGAGALVGVGSASVQATRCLENLRLVLGVSGFEVADVRHLVIYVVGERENLLDAWGAVSTWFGTMCRQRRCTVSIASATKINSSRSMRPS